MYVLTFFGTSCFHSDSRIHTMCHFSRTKHSQYTHRFLIDMHTHTRARACAQHNRSAMAAKWRRRRALHASVLYYFRVREISSESPRLIYHGSRPEFFGFTRPPPRRKRRIHRPHTNVAQVNTCLYTYAGSAGARALCACRRRRRWRQNVRWVEPRSQRFIMEVKIITAETWIRGGGAGSGGKRKI